MSLVLLKKASGVWFKTLARLTREGYTQVIELTGTPSPKNIEDLWSQTYLLDRGERLETGVTKFRHKYMQPVGQIYTTGSRSIDILGPKPGAYLDVMDKIQDRSTSLKSEDWLEMPKIIINDVEITLPESAFKAYETLRVDKVLVKGGKTITAGSGGTLVGKLLQIANGQVYDEHKEVVFVHNEKIKALKDIINVDPVLIFYNYIHDRDLILKEIDGAVLLDGSDVIGKWNRGEIKVLVTHPASAGHGLNLQSGGNHIIWYGLPFNLEWYLQANARIYRQGQKSKSVIITHLTAKKTIETKVRDSLKSKRLSQDEILDFVKVDPPTCI